MQIALALMILATVLLSQGNSAQAVATTPILWLTFAGGLMLAPLAAACGSIWIARGIGRDFPNCRPWLVRFDRLQVAVIGAWLAATCLLLVGCRWPQIVRGNWRLDRWPLVDDLAILAPSLVALVAVWGTYWLVEHSLRKASIGDDGDHGTVWEFIGLHLRHDLGLPLVPVLFVMLLQDLAVPIKTWLGNDITSWVGPLALPAVLILLPWLLRFIWRTDSMSAGPLRERLEGLCNEYGCGVREILVWQTGNRMPNAAITGFLPRLRYLLLSDALLDRLDHVQLAAVVRHELAHLQRRHLINRMLVLGLPVWLFVCAKHAFPELHQQLVSALEGVGISRFWQDSFLLPAVGVAYAITVIGRYSRLLEFDADLAVLDGAAPNADAAARAEAVQPFTDALARISGNLHERSWLHPSVIERTMFLSRCARRPEEAAAYRRRLDLFGAAVIAAFILGAAAWLF